MDNLTLNSTKTPVIITANDYNESTFYIRIPTVIYLSLLIPIGILGNASILYIFGSRLKKSNVQFFIIILAIIDMFSSTIGMPLELIEMVHMHVYSSGLLCKLQRQINYSASIGSALVLLTISVERYIKVCRPTNKQMTQKHSKIVALAILVVCIPVPTPIAVTYDRLPVLVKEVNVTVHQCALRYSPMIFAYYSSFLPVTLMIFITMFVLYWFVLRSARRHFRRRTSSTESTQSVRKVSKRKISRTSMSVICLTAVYVISFTPTLIIGMMTKFYSSVDYSPTTRGLLILFYRSWAVNCSSNPLIFGFFNKTYRDSLIEIAEKLLCIKVEDTKTVKELATTSVAESSK